MATGRPDWYTSMVMHGKHLNEYVPVGVDADGNIIGVMKGDFAGTLKTIAVDTNGVLKANLAVQDVAELIMRPKYGAGHQSAFSTVCAAESFTSLVTVEGKGMIYWGHTFAEPPVGHGEDRVQLYIDTQLMTDLSYITLRKRGLTRPQSSSVYLNVFDSILFYYGVGLSHGMTFESSFELRYYNWSNTALTVNGLAVYALI